MKNMFLAAATLICFSSQSFANKIIQIDGGKAVSLYLALSSAGIQSVDNKVGTSGLYCSIQKESQAGDPGAKREYITLANCSADSSEQINEIDGRKAMKLISALTKAKVPMTKDHSAPAGVQAKSLFVQSIECSKTTEVGQNEKLQEVYFELVNCSIEI